MTDEIIRQLQKRIIVDPVFRHEIMASPLHALQEYPLTEEEKQSFVLPNFSWLIENRLAGVAYPRSEDALVLLQKQGVQALLNLSEEALPAEVLRKYRFQAEHLPIADFTAPTLAQVERALAIIDGFLGHDLSVAVHCAAGLGRTGTILACYLVSQGSSARSAIEQVRTRRPGSIETLEQEAVIEAYEQERQEKRNV